MEKNTLCCVYYSKLFIFSYLLKAVANISAIEGNLEIYSPPSHLKEKEITQLSISYNFRSRVNTGQLTSNLICFLLIYYMIL